GRPPRSRAAPAPTTTPQPRASEHGRVGDGTRPDSGADFRADAHRPPAGGRKPPTPPAGVGASPGAVGRGFVRRGPHPHALSAGVRGSPPGGGYWRISVAGSARGGIVRWLYS